MIWHAFSRSRLPDTQGSVLQGLGFEQSIEALLREAAKGPYCINQGIGYEKPPDPDPSI